MFCPYIHDLSRDLFSSEYAYTTEVTEKSDVYSFGVVLLELLTGRRPVQAENQGGDLVAWIKEAVGGGAAEAAGQIFDRRLETEDPEVVEEMTGALKVALLCTRSSPSERPTMRNVAAMLATKAERRRAAA
jgi:serine/threonine protein kinase